MLAVQSNRNVILLVTGKGGVSMKNVKHGLLAILVLVITPVALAKVEIENRSTQNVEELGVEQIAKSMELGNKLIVEDV